MLSACIKELNNYSDMKMRFQHNQVKFITISPYDLFISIVSTSQDPNCDPLNNSVASE